MADIIKMLLQSKIDVEKSIIEINKQIEQMSNRSDLKKLDLKININPETLKNIDELNKKLGELSGKNVSQSNIKGIVQDFSVLQGQLDGLINEYSKFGTVTSNLNFDKNKNLQGFTIQLKDAQENIQKFKYELKDDSFELKSIQLLDKTQENYNKTLNETVQIKRKLAQEEIKLQQQIDLFKQKQEIGIKNIEGRYKDLYDKNAIAEYRKELQGLSVDTPDITNKMKQMSLGLKDIETNAKNSKRAIDMSAKSSISFSNALKTAFYKFGIWSAVTVSYYGVLRAIRNGISEVIELDTALTELNKVVETGEEELKTYTEQAYRLGETLGRTGKEVINATTEFARAGYNLQESAKLAEQALLLTNVADGLNDTAEAAGYLIAVMKGYDLTVQDTTHVVDLLNEVSNNYAVNTVNLAEGLQRTSGTLSQTGTSMEELAGILTGGYEVLRNMEKVSAGLVTISSRLRGVSESGEEIDGLMPKLQRAFKEFAGIDIQTVNGELRSTYDILEDLSKVWNTLNDEQRAIIGELTSGIRQAPVLNAILKNWESVEGAVKSALDSTGSAVRENEKYLNSLQGRLNSFNSAVSKLVYDTINSELLGSLIDLGTVLIKLANQIGCLN